MIVDIRIPEGPDPLGEWAGECARWLIACEAALSAHGGTCAAPSPAARVMALRLEAGLPAVVADGASDPWPESWAVLVCWAAVCAHAHNRQAAHAALLEALTAASVDCAEAERLRAGMVCDA